MGGEVLKQQPDKGPNEERRRGVDRRGFLTLVAGGAALAATKALPGGAALAAPGPEIMKKGKLELPQKNFFLDALDEELHSQASEKPKTAKEAKRKVEILEKLPEYREIFGDVLDAFIEENIDRTKMFTSKETGASFPYTTLDTGEFAKQLYKKFTDKEPEILEKGVEGAKSMEFVFGSSLNTTAGTTLTAYEEQLRMLVMRLPEAIEAIKAHKEPEHHLIYGIGSPTNVVGKGTPKFAEQVKEKGAYETFGNMYSELVTKQLSENAAQPKSPSLYFWGLSMGGSLAAKTAERLLKNEPEKGIRPQVTQDRATAKERGLPYLQVRADIAPGLDESMLGRNPEIISGFLINGALDVTVTPYVKEWINKENELTQAVLTFLEKRHNIHPNMGEGQKEIKEKMLPDPAFRIAGDLLTVQDLKATLIGGLMVGTPVPKELKITRVVGVRDPYTLSQNRLYQFLRNKSQHLGHRLRRSLNIDDRSRGGSLAKDTVTPDSGNDRTFEANMRHLHPWLRKTEMRRYARAVSALASLKQ